MSGNVSENAGYNGAAAGASVFEQFLGQAKTFLGIGTPRSDPARQDPEPELPEVNAPADDQAGDPPGHTDPWGAYHLLIAILILLGFVAGIATLEELLKRLEHLNALEESGLVACVAIILAKIERYLRVLARWLQQIRLWLVIPRV